MTLTIEIAPDAEAQLREKARRRGQAAEDYVRDLVKRDLSAQEEVAARQRALRELDELTAQRGDPRAEAGLPPLSDEDISCATLYAERGLVNGEL